MKIYIWKIKILKEGRRKKKERNEINKKKGKFQSDLYKKINKFSETNLN